MEILVSVLVLASLLLFGEATRRRGTARALLILRHGGSKGSRGSSLVRSFRVGSPLFAIAAVAAGALVGTRLAGPVGFVSGGACGWLVPRVIERRRQRARALQLERQLADMVETVSLAVRSGLSIGQALEFAASEGEAPMRPLVERMIAERSVGVSTEEALRRFGESIGTEDARMLVLILSIHHRSGGNVAVALEEVAQAIHHRVTVRRELRALTAQGRVSGTILGALPIGFFLVLAATSQRDLGPVYRSGGGIGMLATGLLMEALAYVWIRRLLRVHV